MSPPAASDSIRWASFPAGRDIAAVRLIAFSLIVLVITGAFATYPSEGSVGYPPPGGGDGTIATTPPTTGTTTTGTTTPPTTGTTGTTTPPTGSVPSTRPETIAGPAGADALPPPPPLLPPPLQTMTTTTVGTTTTTRAPRTPRNKATGLVKHGKLPVCTVETKKWLLQRPCQALEKRAF